MSEETGRRGLKDIRDSLSVGKDRANRDTSEVYEFGPFRLEPSERKLVRSNEIVELTPKAFDTLLLLVRNSGHLLEKDKLIEMLWPDTFVEEGSLSNNIFLLRKALGEDPQYIETVPKRGYRFVGALRCLPDGVRGHQEPAQFHAPRSGIVAAGETLPFSRRRTVVGVASLAMLALLAAGWYYRSAGLSRGAIHSVVVLPFENASGDPNAEYLSDGIAESLINSLSRLPNVKVMSRDSAFHHRGKETNAQTVGQMLGGQAVFKGRVVPQGDKLTISAELIDARYNSHIWGQQYSRKPSDIFALQEEIAKEMTAALRVRLTGEEE